MLNFLFVDQYCGGQKIYCVYCVSTLYLLVTSLYIHNPNIFLPISFHWIIIERVGETV